LGKTYASKGGRVTALAQVNLTIRQDEFITLPWTPSRISMKRVWRDQGFTAILVTHDVAEAVTLADRVLMIEDGEIALDPDRSATAVRAWFGGGA
jgi:ABC-type arginine transport system ATPase subunit